jgi:molybdate transport system substrate-binding protein
LALEQQGLVVAESRKTYAIGQLALWDTQSRGKQNVSLNELKNRLNQSDRLSIANPNTAPYGAAAIQLLEALNLLTRLESSLVKGNSVLQAYQYVATGNVNRGLVAYHLIENKHEATLVPQDLYGPLKQQMVIMKSSNQVDNALKFQHFVLSTAVQEMLHDIGYSASETGASLSVNEGE